MLDGTNRAQVFTITWQMCGGRRRAQTPICDKDGVLLTAEKTQGSDG